MVANYFIFLLKTLQAGEERVHLKSLMYQKKDVISDNVQSGKMVRLTVLS